jgi:hypothetical protein
MELESGICEDCYSISDELFMGVCDECLKKHLGITASIEPIPKKHLFDDEPNHSQRRDKGSD